MYIKKRTGQYSVRKSTVLLFIFPSAFDAGRIYRGGLKTGWWVTRLLTTNFWLFHSLVLFWLVFKTPEDQSLSRWNTQSLWPTLWPGFLLFPPVCLQTNLLTSSTRSAWGDQCRRTSTLWTRTFMAQKQTASSQRQNYKSVRIQPGILCFTSNESDSLTAA